MLATQGTSQALTETGAAAAAAGQMLCLIHPIDPRGNKVGGIETHVRMMIAHAPRDWRVLLVGVDGRGDCRLGEIRRLTMEGRTFDFLPVLHFPDVHTHHAARSIFASLTFRFAAGLLRHFLSLRRAVAAAPHATIELQRFEFAVLGPLLGRPTVQVIHGEGNKTDKMDSLIKKFWFLHRMNEEIAIRLASQIICVNPNIVAKLERENPKAAGKAVFMPVAVDTGIFRTSDFTVDDVFRVVFAGRFDEFKNPPLMFRTLRRVHERLHGRFAFHYIGTSDAERFPEFDLVRAFTTSHGYCEPREVAAIMRDCHAGILTSWFEGMPCYLLELLSVGRPIVAIALPQYRLVVKEGQNGYLVERDADEDRMAETLSDRLIEIWSAIRSGKMPPDRIAGPVIPFSVESQLRQHFARHRQLCAHEIG